MPSKEQELTQTENKETENKDTAIKEKEGLTFYIFSKYRGELFGISIIFIMAFHYFHSVIEIRKPTQAHFYSSYLFCKGIGSIGVEVFLFLSGMGLYFSYTKRKDIGAFFRKRFVRILIPYAMYGTVIWFISDIIVKERELTRYFYDLSLFSFWISGEKRLWFISAIVVFYVFFPLFYEIITSKKYKLNTALFFVFYIGAIIVAQTEKPQQFAITEIATTRLPIFVLGIYIGRLVFEKAPIKKWHIALAAATVLMRVFVFIIGVQGKFYTLDNSLLKELNRLAGSAIGKRMESSVFSIGFMAVCILIVAVIKWKPLHSFLKAAGGISLELYMVHVTVNGIIVSEGSLDICKPQVYLLSMVISVSAAILLHISSTAVINKLTAQKPKTQSA